MNMKEFCDRFMGGKEPTPEQVIAIIQFLMAEQGSPLWESGMGGGKTTVRMAQLKYIHEAENLPEPFACHRQAEGGFVCESTLQVESFLYSLPADGTPRLYRLYEGRVQWSSSPAVLWNDLPYLAAP